MATFKAALEPLPHRLDLPNERIDDVPGDPPIHGVNRLGELDRVLPGKRAPLDEPEKTLKPPQHRDGSRLAYDGPARTGEVAATGARTPDVHTSRKDLSMAAVANLSASLTSAGIRSSDRTEQRLAGRRRSSNTWATVLRLPLMARHC